jgi:O-antigen ligase
MWLHVLGIMQLGSAEEGNPVDAVIYLSLVLAGLYVLNGRAANVSEVVRQNAWLFVFLAYCFIAIFWSDYPLVAAKRWIKILGHPVMGLIVLTEPAPAEAVSRLIKRAAYVLLPFSMLAIKFYPQIGRSFDTWTGLAVNNGICESKNMLGASSFVIGFFLLSQFREVWRFERTRARRRELWLLALLLYMAGWLLIRSHSATALFSLLIAVGVSTVLGRRWLNKRRVGTYAILTLFILSLIQINFHIFEKIVDLSGHSTTVVGRMELWSELLRVPINPILGVGFESFWLGDRLILLHEGRPWQPNEAHNGYLEIYLNLGLIGLTLLVCLIIATFRKIRVELIRNPNWGRYRMGFLIAVIFYNFTEVSFRGLSLIWFAFYIIALDYATPRYEPVETAIAVEGEEEPIYAQESAHA